jgi:hypothetical protein
VTFNNTSIDFIINNVTLAADQPVNVIKWGGTAVEGAYVQANAAQIGGQTAVAAGAVTVGSFVGNDIAALSVDSSGYVKLSANQDIAFVGLFEAPA